MGREPMAQCPFLKEPCIGDRCKLWIKSLRQTEGGVVDVSDCTFNQMFEVQARLLTEQVRTIATVDKLRNENIGAHNVLMRVIDAAKAERAKLSSGSKIRRTAR